MYIVNNRPKLRTKNKEIGQAPVFLFAKNKQEIYNIKKEFV